MLLSAIRSIPIYGEIIMRRMITETDVEKLDSIQPSEIQKLGQITEADIQSVKAMQSPKNATTNYVLTADGQGKATYQQSKSGARISYSFGGGGSSIPKSWFGSGLGSYKKADFPGFAVAKTSFNNPSVSVGFDSFPFYTKDDGTKVYIAPGDYFFMQGDYTDILFGVKTEIYNQFVTDTANNKYAEIYTGKSGQYSYEQN